MSEALSFPQRLQAGLAHWGQVLTGRASRGQAAGTQGLPVNLGSYDFARNSAGSAHRLQSVDQALVWVVVALLMWGMVMVYSASIAMPDNPRFSRYTQTHFLTRHLISMVVGSVMALLAFQVPTETWEKVARPLFVVSLVLLALVATFSAVHLALRALAALLEMPRQARHWRAQQKERATHAALLEALGHLLAGRFIRSRKAALAALAREKSLTEPLGHAVQLRALAHLVAAESAQALQDKASRDEHLHLALDVPKSLAENLVAKAYGELRSAGCRMHLDISTSTGHTAVITDPASGMTFAVPVALIVRHLIANPARRTLRQVG